MPTMHARQRRFCLFAAALAGSLAGPPNCPAVAQVVRPVVTPTSSDAAAMTPDERRALEEYKRAWQNYSAAAGAYWNSVAERRQLRNGKRARGERLSVNDYVLAQPPVYTGPPNPLKRPPHPVYVPVVADFLAAAQREFGFAPRLPQSESEFKRAYAKVALAAGLSRDQIVATISCA